MGLKSDGSIVVWGSNTIGQYNVPAPNSGFVAIAAKSNHSLGVRAVKTCPADFNHDSLLDSRDFFDFLNAFSGQKPSADFNGDSVISSQDFFGFLASFFSGCP